MNFKTTIVLLVVLIVVAGAFFIIQHGQPQTSEQVSRQTGDTTGGQPLFNLIVSDVKGLTITNADGKQTSVIRKDLGWALTAPVAAQAADYEAKALIHTILDVHSLGRPASAPGADAGLDRPRYRVDVIRGDGKTFELVIGNKTPLGDQMYAQLDGGDIYLIDVDLAKTLDTAADDIRDKHLVPIPTYGAKDVRISFGDQEMELIQKADKWTIRDLRKKQELPGDFSEISTYLGTLGGVVATAYVPHDSEELTFADFAQPTYKVWFSTAAPTTRPGTTLPSDAGSAWMVVGAPDESKDNYFVEMSDGLYAKITSAFVDSSKKTPLDLRDKAILDISPDDVTAVGLVKETYPQAPATQTTQTAAMLPAISERVELARRSKIPPGMVGPVAPTTRPTSGPAANPPGASAGWEFTNAKGTVDNQKVEMLLKELHPLRASKYLEKSPDSVWSNRDLLTLQTGIPGSASAKTYHLEVIRPANGDQPYVIYNGLTFEVIEAVPAALEADLHATAP